MDETVYQCPECNFNADNLNELDSHIVENHSNEINPLNGLNSNLLKSNSIHLNKNNYTNGFNTNNQNDDEEDYEDNANNTNFEDDDEDFFNERNNFKQNGNSNHQNDLDLDENGYEINERNEEMIDEDEDFFANETQTNEIDNENENENFNFQHNTINQNESINQIYNKTANRNGQQFRPIKPNIQTIQNGQPVINSDNHYERQYACKRCDFFTNNPRAVLYHRKEFHLEKINVHECQYCQYASQYSGKVERHTLLRHKIDINSSKLMSSQQKASMNKLGDESQNHDPSIDLNQSNSQSILVNKNDTSISNTSLQNTQNQIAKFQCNYCPCKYKRSSDLTKHLRHKHSVNTNSLNDYLKMSNRQQNLNENENQDFDLIDINHHNNNDEDYENNSINISNYNSSQSNNSQKQLNTSLSRSYLNRNFNQIQKKFINEQTNIIVENTLDQTNLNPNTYQCPYCTFNTELNNPNEYLLHVKDHLCGKAFRCVLCNSVYKYRGDCVVHLKRKHQKADMIAHSYVDKFNLDNLEIGDIYGLLKPKEIDEPENDEKLFGCSYCDYKANYKGDVYKHQTRRHPGTAKSVLSLANQNTTVLSNCSNQSSENNSANNSFNLNNTNGYANGNGTHYNHSQNNNLSQYDDDNQDFFLDENENQNNQNEPNEIVINDDDDEGENFVINEDDDDEDFFNERNQQNNANFNNNTQEYENENNIIQQDINDENLPSNINSNDIRHQCKFCPFAAKSQAKLQLHLATHYNLKQFMCPICKRRANFKWDIQKHMRKIHNDYTSEVICLTENEARASISNYVEPKTYTNSNPLIYNSTIEKLIETNKLLSESSNSNSNISANNIGSPLNNTNSNLSQIVSSLGLSERKYKCSLCMRTSKWQWDIKKHLRTVHKGLEGDVVVLEDVNNINNLNNNNKTNVNDFDQNQSINLNTSLPIAPNFKSQTSSPLIYNGVNMNQTTIGSDTSGNKKFRCTLCPYRSNWKADMYRHLRKRHQLAQPKIDDIIVLSPEEAASTLEEYERLHGINIRKRARFDNEIYRPVLNTGLNNGSNDGFHSDTNNEITKRFKNDTGSIISTSESNEANNFGTQMEDEAVDSESQETMNTQIESSNDNHGYESDLNGSATNGVERLPVSIAELNIKPYKCLKCGFRSDRKSDTLRHIRVKHALQPLQAFKFLRILSIKEASETIDEYESTRLYKKAKPNNRDYALINSIVQQTNQNLDPSSALSNLKQLSKTHGQLNQINSQYINTNPVQIHRPNPLNNQYSTRSNVGLTVQAVNSTKDIKPNINDIEKENEILNINNTNKIENIDIAQSNKSEIKSRLSSIIDYFKCPFCSFKHKSRVLIKKHLSTHYLGNSIQSSPIFKCTACNFKSEWQYTCKRHIIISHITHGVKATVVKINPNKEKKHIRKEDVQEKTPTNPKVGIRIVIKRAENGESSAHQITESESDSEVRSETHSNEANSNNKYNFYNNNNTNDNQENDDFIHCDDSEDTIEDVNQLQPQQHNEELNEDLNENDKKNLVQDDDTTAESIVLTGYDGKQFTAHYLVSNNSINLNGSSSLNVISPKKKMFYCKTCPYKTNNYCNLKQHLLQHRFRDGFFKCRYCPYYVSMIRLLKQHEILHTEYAPRENCSLNNSLDTGSQVVSV